MTTPPSTNFLSSVITAFGDSLNFTAHNNTNSSGLPWDETPAQIRQYLLIFRLVLLALGLFGNFLLIFIYIKCSSIVTTRLAVYIINLAIAFLIDLIDVVLWSLKEFGINYETDFGLPPIAIQISRLPTIGLPTTSLFFLLMIIDRFFATFFARCYKGCYGCKPPAILLAIIVWLISFFFYFILTFPNLLFPHDHLYTLLRFWVSYLGPFAIKLLLVIILFIKRRVVPDNDESQAFIERGRQALYYTLTILIFHLIFSLPYYLIQLNLDFRLVHLPIDEWIQKLCYFLQEIPLILNPIFVLSIHPEFKDSIISVCTCSGRARRDAQLGDDHAESQPLAPLATSPIAEEKEHLDEAES